VPAAILLELGHALLDLLGVDLLAPAVEGEVLRLAGEHEPGQRGRLSVDGAEEDQKGQATLAHAA